MQSAAELLKKHMLLLHCGLPACHPPRTAEGTSQVHTFRNIHTHWALSLEPSSGNHKVQMQQWHHTVQARQNTKFTIQAQTHNTAKQYMQALIHTFSRHTGIPGIVSLLRCLIAHCVATFGPSQHTECPVQPPEGAAPHWRSVKVSYCEGDRGEREALYRLPHPEHAQTCLNLPPHSQSNAFSLLNDYLLVCCHRYWWRDEIPVWSRRPSLHIKAITLHMAKQCTVWNKIVLCGKFSAVMYPFIF